MSMNISEEVLLLSLAAGRVESMRECCNDVRKAVNRLAVWSSHDTAAVAVLPEERFRLLLFMVVAIVDVYLLA